MRKKALPNKRDQIVKVAIMVAGAARPAGECEAAGRPPAGTSLSESVGGLKQM